MKRSIQQLNRTLHKSFLTRPVADAVAIYFHSIERRTWESFRTCIRHWMDLGYRVVDPIEFVEAADGEKRLFVSFDDHYRSWHSALGLLEELSLKATFFVNTLPFRGLAEPETISEYFDRIDHHLERVSLSTGELCEISAAGHTIGCHSHSHFNLQHLAPARLPQEILQSKAQLEDILGQPIAHFPYPFGMRRFFSERLRQYCTSHGFRTVSNAIPGLLYKQQRLDSINRTPWNLGQDLILFGPGIAGFQYSDNETALHRRRGVSGERRDPW